MKFEDINTSFYGTPLIPGLKERKCEVPDKVTKDWAEILASEPAPLDPTQSIYAENVSRIPKVMSVPLLKRTFRVYTTGWFENELIGNRLDPTAL
ncbi:hypothetical protein HZS_7567 [Henneguya salminicola]|nr:hypothetical protein HZS_7567 [Henneguya salminicola]